MPLSIPKDVAKFLLINRAFRNKCCLRRLSTNANTAKNAERIKLHGCDFTVVVRYLLTAFLGVRIGSDEVTDHIVVGTRVTCIQQIRASPIRIHIPIRIIIHIGITIERLRTAEFHTNRVIRQESAQFGTVMPRLHVGQAGGSVANVACVPWP